MRASAARERGRRPVHKLHVVVNPASGQDEPVLAALDRALRSDDCTWDLSVTREDGDAGRMAAAAAADGADVVAAYGGDGTVSEVANALIGTNATLAILPGGTGNVVAQELGLPSDLERCAALARGVGSRVGAVDVIETGERCCLQRIGIGADARVVLGASREQKDRLGWLAYLSSGLEQLAERELATYQLEIDGRRLEVEAIACLVGNIGRLGRGDIQFASAIDLFDGKLDVLLLRALDLATIGALGGSVLRASVLGAEGGAGAPEEFDPSAPLQHIQCEEVSVRAEPTQPMHGDGEPLGSTPLEARVRTGALRIVLPASA